MKKIVFAVAFCIIVMGAKAQEGNNNCVWAAMNTYNGGGGPDDLEHAIKCSDEAIANESTSVKGKTWFYRGELFSQIAADSVLKKSHLTASLEAANAFQKLSDLNDPKFRDWDECSNYILNLTITLMNSGERSYKEKNFALAYKQFIAVKQMNDVLSAKTKRKPIVNRADILRDAVLSAENAGNTEDAIKVEKEWITTDDTVAYVKYIADLQKQGKTEEAKKIVDEGLAKYPKYSELLTDKINFFLADSNYVGAMNYVNSLIEVEPKNVSLYLVKAQAYDKLGKVDSGLIFYARATEVAPKDVRAWVSLGAYYVNKAKPLLEAMNALTTSAEDTKKYNALKGQVKELYTKAKPYLEKVLELDPKDEEISRVHKRVEAFLAE